jgi:hypothetical protein
MRWRSFFFGLTMMAVTGLAAKAQSRIYSAGSNDQPRAAAHEGGGMVRNGGSSQGVVLNSAPGTGASVTQGSAPAAPRGSNSTNTTANARWNFNRPILTASDPERERERHDRDRHFRCAIPEGCSRAGQSIYPYYVYPPEDETNYGDQQQQPTEQVVEPQGPAPTIFENRPGYTPPPIKSYQHSFSPAGQTANADQTADNGELSSAGGERSSAADPQPTTILVFRDGHQLEIGNYAIVGNTLYNIAGGNDTHKIQLADLDLDKTIKANQARGYEFRLPKRQGS